MISKHNRVTSAIIDAEMRAFYDTMHLSGHIRGDEVLPYCALLRDHEDKGIGFLLRQITEEDREKLKTFNADDLKSIAHLTNLPTVIKISMQSRKFFEGSENLRGGRWTPKQSFRDKVSKFTTRCWPNQYIGPTNDKVKRSVH
jgi:hypothetical protein